MVLRFLLLCFLMLSPHLTIGQMLHNYIYNYKKTKRDILIHSIIWSSLIEIPLTLFFFFWYDNIAVNIYLISILIFNIIARYIIDYNNIIVRTIDYKTDQMLHIIQIFISAIIALIVYYNHI